MQRGEESVSVACVCKALEKERRESQSASWKCFSWRRKRGVDEYGEEREWGDGSVALLERRGNGCGTDLHQISGSLMLVKPFETIPAVSWERWGKRQVVPVDSLKATMMDYLP